MAAYTDLPVDWQEKLEQKAGMNPYIEVIYDPDGQNITLTGKYSIREISPIKMYRDIDIEWGRRPNIDEIRIIISDPDNYLNPHNSESPFHNAMAILALNYTGGTKIYIEPKKVQFSTGEFLIISDGTNYERFVVSDFETGTIYHTITTVNELKNSYLSGTAIFTEGMEYKDVWVRLRCVGCSSYITLYWGKLSRLDHYEGYAELILTDKRRLLLDQKLVGAESGENKLMFIDTSGKKASSVVWNEGSAGILDREKIIVKSNCRLGKWTIKFDSDVDFTVDGPDVKNSTGKIALSNINSLELENAVTGLNGASSVFVSGNYAHVVSSLDSSYRIYNISDPSSPTLISTVSGSGEPNYLGGASAIYVNENYAYICCFTNQSIVIFDISDPYSPKRKGFLAGQTNLDGAEAIIVKGSYAYVVSSNANSLTIFDISNPNIIIEKSSVTGSGDPYYLGGACDIFIQGNYVYITSRDDSALVIYDVSNVTNPICLGSISGAGEYLSYAQGIWLKNDYAFVCGGGSDALVVIDVSIPNSPVRIGQLQDATNLNGTRDIQIIEDYAYITCEDGDSITVVDISDIDSLNVVCSISGAGSPNYLDEARGLFVAGEYLYSCAYSDDSFCVFKINSSGSADYLNDQLIIPLKAWSGLPKKNDEVTFFTGIIWENTNVIQAIYDFLVDHVNISPEFIDCSSFFGDKRIGVLYEQADAGSDTIKIAIKVPIVIKAGETLRISDGTNEEDITVITGNDVQSSYPPYIVLKVSNLSSSYAHGSIVIWRQREFTDDSFSFDAEYEYCDEEDIFISIFLDRDMTKLQALELLAAHADGFVYQDSWGKERIHIYRQRSSLTGTIQYNTNLKVPDPKIENIEVINKILIKFGYDYNNNNTLYEVLIPYHNEDNRSLIRYRFFREKEIVLPGLWDNLVVTKLAQNKYYMFENGLDVITLNMTLQGILACIGDHFHLKSLYPELDCEVEVTGIEINFSEEINVKLVVWNYDQVLWE